MTERVLITGGAGFIGSHTTDALLEAGYAVRILDSLDPQVHGPEGRRPEYLSPEAELVVGDVRDADTLARALEGVDFVYHMAALTGVTQSMHDVRRYLDVGVTGTATLWDVLVNRKNRVRKVVLSSSRAVYGEGAYRCDHCEGLVYPKPRGEAQLQQRDWDCHCPTCGGVVTPAPTPEDKPLDPLSVYAHSKRFQEDICDAMSLAYDLPVVTLRYFNVYGPRQALRNPYTGIAPVFASRVRNGLPIDVYEDGLPVRDFVHVRDVVQANLLALDYPGEGMSVFNVGTGEQLTVLDMAKAICQEMGHEPRLEFNGRYRVGDIRSCYADLTRSRKELGFEPTIPFRDGVAELVEWVRTQEQEEDRYEQSLRDLRTRGLVRE
ncbi:MAG: NAD-dependent epimerase/dehydratase family protein [Anaerolineae bacterium]|jgi:dTDP-L-rhamnose 4-epimerase